MVAVLCGAVQSGRTDLRNQDLGGIHRRCLQHLARLSAAVNFLVKGKQCERDCLANQSLLHSKKTDSENVPKTHAASTNFVLFYSFITSFTSNPSTSATFVRVSIDGDFEPRSIDTIVLMPTCDNSANVFCVRPNSLRRALIICPRFVISNFKFQI